MEENKVFFLNCFYYWRRRTGLREVVYWDHGVIIRNQKFLTDVRDDVGLLVLSHAGICCSVGPHTPLHDLLEALKPVGFAAGAARLLLRHRGVFQEVMFTDLLVCQDAVVLVGHDVLQHEGHGLEDPALVEIINSKERFLIS